MFDLNMEGMMITKQITAKNTSDKEIRELYESAFPKNERIPWNDLMRLIEEMHLDFTAYYDAGTFVGLTIVYPRSSFNWFWYFAVREELRNKGYGQEMLRMLIGKYKGQTIVFDMESPRQACDNIVQRRRRHEFYLRNGFRDTNVFRSYDNLEMTIMIIGEGTFTLQDWDDMTNELRQHWRWEDCV